MMQQYQRMKREVPEGVILLFRLGDFFEMFFEDAKVCAAILNLTLTKRNTVPMCGVPAHSIEGYISKLIQAGHRVALCDQVSEPRPGQVVDRAITQIFSPGCTLSLEITQPKENRYLAAIFKNKNEYGFAFLDVTTGQFQLTEVADEKTLQDEIIRLQPREILYPTQQAKPALPEMLQVVFTPYDDWVFERDFSFLTLREHFKVRSLDGFGCQNMLAGIGAAGALLHYVTKTLRGSASHVLTIKTYTTADYLILDTVTQRNLELIETGASSASNTTLFHAIDRTVTAMGARELKNWILHPLRTAAGILARQQMIAAWLDDVGQLETFQNVLQEVRDLERLIGRVAQGSGNARDLQALRFSLEQLPAIIQIASQLSTPLATSLTVELKPQPELIELIQRAIVPEPPLALKEGNIISPGYHAELDELHAAMRDGKTWLAELQAREQERTGIKSLKVRFNQVFGYYIEITASNLAQVPSNYTRKQTMANAERFITPELKEMEGKILGAEERARKLEYELFLSVRDHVAAQTAQIQASAHAIAALDALAGLASLARLQGYCRPEISTDSAFQIIEGRHPVLEQKLRDERFVPNDTLMNQETCRLVILTGPNMAGKSTYIRQVALIALLFHIGSYVPAQTTRIPVMDRIFTRIGASDDLSRGQSTFMVEMNETANILNHATENSLVILDEIGRGTSTFDGLSIAWAVAEHLNTQVRAKTLFATHYHELTELSELLPSVQNYNVAVREWQDQIIFLRKIIPGGADKSYGIQVARLAGLPKTVLERARNILRQLEEHELDASGKPFLAVKEKSTNPSSRPTKEKKKSIVPQMDLFKNLGT